MYVLQQLVNQENGANPFAFTDQVPLLLPAVPETLRSSRRENRRDPGNFEPDSAACFERKFYVRIQSVGKTITLFLFQAMVTHGRVELLAHPLSQKYLQMKWNSYGKYFHVANLLFYTIFLAFVTAFTAHLMHLEESHPYVNETTTALSVRRQRES